MLEALRGVDGKAIAPLLAVAACGLTGCSPSPPAAPTPPGATPAQAPSLGNNPRARDVAAYVSYYKIRGYRVNQLQQSYNPDGTLKHLAFRASLPPTKTVGIGGWEVTRGGGSVSTTYDGPTTITFP